MGDKLDEELMIAAHHESSHAIARYIAGWNVGPIKINGIVDGHYYGGTEVRGTDLIRDFQLYPHEHLDCPLAGYASTIILCDKGQLKFYQSHLSLFSTFMHGCSDDIDNFHTLWKSLGWNNVVDIEKQALFHMMAESLTAPRILKYWTNVVAISEKIISEFNRISSHGDGFIPIRIKFESFEGLLPSR